MMDTSERKFEIGPDGKPLSEAGRTRMAASGRYVTTDAEGTPNRMFILNPPITTAHSGTTGRGSFRKRAAYLAGPMTGYDRHNADAFEEAAANLRKQGWRILSPVELDKEDGVDFTKPAEEDQYVKFLRRDLVRILSDEEIDTVIVLPGWEESRGVSTEVHLARELGMAILSYPTLEAVKRPSKYKPPAEETILEEAERLVSADRGESYGHPAEDFSRTAGAWKALFGWDTTPEKVALAMIVVKLSRLVESPNRRDSVVDLAGYSRAYDLVVERLRGGLK